MKIHQDLPRLVVKAVFCAILFLFFTALSDVSNAQVVPQRVKSTVGLQVNVPIIGTFPPLNMGMPFDVLLGYIYYDSLCRTMTRHAIDSFASRLTNSDTLTHALKYLYEMDDYNPVTFSQWLKVTPSLGHYKTSPGYVYTNLIRVASAIIPDTQRTAILSGSDFIAHVRINSIQSYDDTAQSDLQNEVIVDCAVLDTIKGDVYPPCLGTIALHGKGSRTSSIEDCLQFVYSPSSPRMAPSGDVLYSWMPRLQDSLGNPWISVDQEYVVFLSIRGLGNDSSNFVLTIYPAMFKSSVSGLYPIQSGVVQDTNNDFGFGANLPTADFIAALRSRIYSLKNP